MTFSIDRNTFVVVFLLAVAFLLWGGVLSHALAQGIDFSKADGVGNSFVAWVRKNPLVWFFTIALIGSGLAAAFNKISWMWFGYILLGAFVAFGSSKLVTFFAKQFA